MVGFSKVSNPEIDRSNPVLWRTYTLKKLALEARKLEAQGLLTSNSCCASGALLALLLASPLPRGSSTNIA